MASVSLEDIKRNLQRALVVLAATLAALCLLLTMLWRDRGSLADIDLPFAPTADESTEVTVTWLGVTTLLFDDGDTQILIDGFFSRPSLLDVLTDRPIENDAATINYALNEFRMRRLAAIIPVHSHFDHAMDVGAVANRSSASLIGTESTAQIARGAGVPEDQIVVAEAGAEYAFGRFTVRMLPSEHGPIGWRGSVPFPGTIDSPLRMPASVSRWREGGSWSIIIAHPAGTSLVQGSAAVASLADQQVDVVFLGVGMLSGLGRDYVDRYWQSTVTSTGARTVIPVHFDDYTRPFGEIALAPRVLDDFAKSIGWLDEIRSTWDAESRLYLPGFGVPLDVYREAEDDESGTAVVEIPDEDMQRETAVD